MKSLVLLIRRSVFFDILHTLSPVESSKTLAKMCFFLEATDGEHFFREMKERYKVFCVEILQTSLTVKNNDNVVESGCFEKHSR